MKDGPKLRASNPVVPLFNDYGVPIPAKQSTWKSRAFAAAAELAKVCKAKSRRRDGKGWGTYSLDVCPITGLSYPDPDPFVDSPRISAHRGGLVIFTMPERDGDHLHELVGKLRAAGHALPRMADYEDPWDRRMLYHDPADDDR
jgi:hypothetical protein